MTSPFVLGPTPPRLADLRREYPEYDDMPDSELAAALHDTYFSDADPEEFAASVGLDGAQTPKAVESMQLRRKTRVAEEARAIAGLDATPPRLDELRRRFPQYQDMDDAAFVAGLGESVYADMSPSALHEALGYEPPEPEPEGDLLERAWTKVWGEEEPIRIDPATGRADPTQEFKPDRSLRGLFRQGWQSYLSAQATARAVGAAETFARADEIAAGEGKESEEVYRKRYRFSTDPRMRMAERQMREDRAARAAAGDEGARSLIEREARELRAESIALMKRATDERKRRRLATDGVEMSPKTLEMMEADGVGSAFSAFADDPINIMMEITAQSLPHMAEGLGVGYVGALMGGRLGFALGMGAGSGSVEYRSSFAEGLEREGVDLEDPEALIRAAEDPDLLARVAKRASVRAGAIGAFDAASAGLASKTLTPFVKKAVAREIANAAAQAGAQAALGAGGEAAAQLASGDEFRFGAVLAEAVGEGLTSSVEVGAATITGVRRAHVEAEIQRITNELEAMFPRDPEPEGGGSGPAPAPAPISPASEESGGAEGEALTREPGASDEVFANAGGAGRAVLEDEAFANAGGATRATLEDEAFANVGGAGRATLDEGETFSNAGGASRADLTEVLPDDAIIGPSELLEDPPITGEEDARADARAAEERLEEAQRALEHEADLELEYELDYEASPLDYLPNSFQGGANAVTRALADAGGIDVGTLDVHSDHFREHFSANASGNVPAKKMRAAYRNIEPGVIAAKVIAASIHHSGAKTWRELATLKAIGQKTILEHIRSLEGLEGFRLPDEVVERHLREDENAARAELELEREAYAAEIAAANIEQLIANLGEDAAEAARVAVKDAVNQAGIVMDEHPEGDLWIQAGSKADLEIAIELARAVLAHTMIETPQGTARGIEFEAGIGRTREEAHAARAEAEARPPSKILEMRATGPLMMQGGPPGANHVPVIGLEGQLPINANNELVLGNGRTVRIPNKPVRREHILRRIEQAFGLQIYQGRVKGPKTRLGFYRPGVGEIRIRNANDAEVVAHEIAHWLDERHPWMGRVYRAFEAEVREVSYDVEILEEGFAEFLRLFLTQEIEAIKRAPSFYDAFRRELEKHPDLATPLYDIQEMIHAWMNQGADARLDSKYQRHAASFVDKVRALYPVEGFLQKGLDGLRGIKTAELAATGGLFVEAYNRMRLAIGGSNAVLEATYFFGTPSWRDDGQGIEINGKGLRAIFGRHWGSDDLALYMIARRGAELRDQGRENLLRQDEIEAGLKKGEANPEFARIFDEYQAFNSRILDFAQDAGILSPKVRRAMERMNRNYVPFNRVVDQVVNGKTRSSRGAGNPFMRLKGGTLNIGPVWENIINNTGTTLRLAMINDAKRSLYRTLGGTTNQQGALFATPIETDTRKMSVPLNTVLRGIVEAMGMTWADYQMVNRTGVGSAQDVATVEMINEIRVSAEEMVDVMQAGIDPTGQVDFYMDQGKKRFFEIGDEALWDSIKFLGPKPTNLVLAFFGGFSSLLRRTVTAAPVFQSSNFLRDTANAWLMSESVQVPAARALRVVFSKMHSDPDYMEMMINGGGFANRSQGLQQHEKAIYNPASLVAWYDRFMGRFENANRLAEYKAARAAGDSPRRASILSREISTDFAMRGSAEIVRYLAAAIPFLNARAQGLYQIGRIGTRHKGRWHYPDLLRRYLFRGGLMMAASVALYALNKDDDRYKDQPEDQRDLFWWFPTGAGEDDYVLIPKPFENGMFFGTIPERIFELTETQNGKEFADAMLWMVLQTLNADLTPQAFKPYQDMEKNRTFTGQPILPFYLENVEASEQFTYYTSRTAREAGEHLGISPIKFDHYVRGYFGTLGVYATAAMDATIRATVGDDEGGEPPTSGETWKENIVTKVLIDRFVNEGPPRRTKHMADLYDMIEEVEKVANTVARKERRRAADIEAYINDADKSGRLSASDMVSGIKAELAALRESMDAVRLDPELDGDQKRVQLWELKRQQQAFIKRAALELRDIIDAE